MIGVRERTAASMSGKPSMPSPVPSSVTVVRSLGIYESWHDTTHGLGSVRPDSAVAASWLAVALSSWLCRRGSVAVALSSWRRRATGVKPRAAGGAGLDWAVPMVTR